MNSLEAHRGRLFGVAYGMVGVPSEAEDLVQETFVRALERALEREDNILPWLITVCVNLARDRLRRRQRASYPGVWLPVPTNDAPDLVVKERLGFAVLAALEGLSDKARAVWVLRVIGERSVEDTASALEISRSDVKVSLHRARKALNRYEARASSARALEVVAQLMARLSSSESIASLLAAEVAAYSDGGGKYRAAMNPIVGALDVDKLLSGLAKKGRGILSGVTPVTCGGLHGVELTFDSAEARDAPRAIMLFDLDEEGLVRTVFSLSAERFFDEH